MGATPSKLCGTHAGASVIVRESCQKLGARTVGALVAFGLVVTVSCDKEPNGESAKVGQQLPSAVAARDFLEAVQYRDVDRAWLRHVESTRRGAYCKSEAFAKVLERTRQEKTKADCDSATRVSDRERAALEDDAELLLQILRFTCEHPEGDCLDYQRRVFTSQVPQTEFWSNLENFEIRRVHPGEDETAERADVYVDYWTGKRDEASIEHRTITLRKIDDEWLVETTFGEPESVEPPSD